jgi:hypothetical protein
MTGRTRDDGTGPTRDVDAVTVPDEARFICTAHAVVEFVSGDAG